MKQATFRVVSSAMLIAGAGAAPGYSHPPLRAQGVRGGGGNFATIRPHIPEPTNNTENANITKTVPLRELDERHRQKQVNINLAQLSLEPFMRDAVTPKPFADHANIAPKRCPTGEWLVGCFLDTQTEHRRYYHEHVPPEDQVSMTPDVCYEFCLNASGVQFFGLRRGYECYCSPFFHDTGKGGRGECDMPCTGNPRQICGGDEKSSIYEMHDCNNLPALNCRNPPPVIEHAAHYGSNYYRKTGTPCANSKLKPLTNENSHCEVTCDTGYELTENDLECIEKGDRLSYSWATIVGKAVCSPVPCGLPPALDSSNHVPRPMFFPENVTYTCHVGHTTNTHHDGPKAFDTTCQADQRFSEPVGCHRVNCHKCPDFQYTEAPDEQDDRFFQDDCNYRCMQGYTLDTTPLTGLNGVFMTSCKADGNFSKPRICKHVSCGPRQPIPHGDIVTTGEGIGSTGIKVFQETVDYKCHEGYTLTGQAGGEQDQTRECLYTGEYSLAQECKPVACGYPARVEHSSFDPSPRFFPETVTYTCNYGYSLTGQAGGNIMQTIGCGSDGKFTEDAPTCHPVECGPPPTVQLAGLDGPAPVMINYASDAVLYICDPGYSAIDEDDVWTPNKNKFSLTCRADGTFSPPLSCINIHDCMVQSCGNFGSCVDFPTPTGVHFDDYECACQPGYEQTLIASTVHATEQEKTCTNINDCPRVEVCGGENPFSLSRGACVDKLIDYDCLCSSGYEVTKLPTLPDNDTCTPVKCGPAPKVDFASSATVGVEVDYETLPWTYTCDEGYTLDGNWLGAKTTVKHCTAQAAISSGPMECLPVSCGATHSAPHADMSPPLLELHYDEELTYTCEVGYSLDSQAGGPDTFKVNCQANGTQTAMSHCLPVECGIPEPTSGAKEFASYVPAKAGTLVFKETARITCDVGYSLDQSPEPDSAEYVVNCLSNGSFGYLRKCKPVLCGVPKRVQFAEQSVHTAMVFPETLEYTCNHGYSLNGNITGETTFAVSCQHNATFSPLKACLPVSCGPAPRLENATYPGTSHVYLERAIYRCLEGFSTDGDADGPKSFALNCAGTAEYLGLPGCKPVQCGDVKERKFAKQVVGPNGMMLGSLLYGQVAVFECDPGYSKDGRYASTHLMTTVRCQADGTMTNPSPCLNNNDCEAPDNHCSRDVSPMTGPGADGHCVDHEKPTGVHLDDFHCDCNSGFQENISSVGVRYCYNVNDCPLDVVHEGLNHITRKDACQPGICHDLVNNYECECPWGYYEGRNLGANLPKDCLPYQCGKPPAADFATTPITEEEFYDMPRFTYTCETGYTLDGTANGVKTYEGFCQADGTFSPQPQCLPVACGDAPVVHNSTFPAGPKFFPEEVPYQCNAGFSLDATYAGVSNKKFESECLADGNFAPVQPCLPIKCPAIEKQSFTVNDDSGTILHFPMKVAKTCMVGYALDKDQHDMTTYTIFCNDEGKLVGGGALVNARENWKQCEAIDCGPFPTIADGHIAGSRLYSESATATCDTGFSVDQSVTPAMATYVTMCQSNGDYSHHPDCLPVSCGSAPFVTRTTRSDEGEKFYRETVTYTLDVGYTLNGQHDGPKQFEIRCQSDGSFTATQQPQPVTCGAALERKNAQYPKLSRTYMEIETYKCAQGHSVDQRAWINGGISTFNLTCHEDGLYYWLHAGQKKEANEAECRRVNCGVATPPTFSDPVGTGVMEKLFKDDATFKCKPGYSLNATLAGGLDFYVTCRANGTFSPHPGCLNMNDCEANMCEHGRLHSSDDTTPIDGHCVDHEVPTGTHVNDYHCVCDSGYQQLETSAGEHYCSNIPNCPVSPEVACLPGSCEDLVNDYKCHCPAGYFVGENTEKSWPHDCLPLPCGTPPTVKNATTREATREVYYAESPVPYTCDTGFTLDTVATGEKNFELSCKTDQTFTEAPDCLPVACGLAPHALNSTYNGGPKEFPETVSYTCDAGFSLDETFAGDTNKKFGSECLADGTFAPLRTCLAIKCPAMEKQSFTVNDDSGTVLHFPMQLPKTCMSGYALDKDKHETTTYTIFCNDEGKLVGGSALSDAVESWKQCEAIDCGPFPTIAAGTINGSQLFSESARATCNTGFSVDRSVSPAAATYVTRCQSNGGYTAHPDCLAVTCGTAPVVRVTTRSDTGEKFYEETVTYTLDTGYTLNGQHDGTKDFTITCQANGLFTDTETPQPVTCGEAPAKKHSTQPHATLTYMQVESYDCLQGYAVDQKAWIDGGMSGFDLTCHEDGKYYWLHESLKKDASEPECKLVSCGVAEAPSHSEPTDAVEKFFMEETGFKCKPGYSLNGTLAGGLDFHVTCRANGTFSPHPGCINMNDCEATMCEPKNSNDIYDHHGKCVDHAEPTGTHVNDYHCECDSGYQQLDMESTGVHYCSNIPDCPISPEIACLPGTCQDLVNDYKCHCPAGYKEDENKAKSWAHDCLPLPCNLPPKVKYATTEEATRKVFYAESPVPYTCDKGYTLDGVATGEKNFELTCQTDQTFTAAPTCLPVKCGDAPQVYNSTWPVGPKEFPEKVPYLCDDGFSLDETFAGQSNKKFESECLADGSFVPVQSCLAIKCPALEKQSFTVNDDSGTILHFPMQLAKTCMAGYALNKNVHHANTYTIFCDDEGKLVGGTSLANSRENWKQCEAINCGPLPRIQNGKVVGSTLFSESATATCTSGYSVDHTVAPEAATYVTRCQTNGDYTAHPDCLPVSCGSAPVVSQTTRSDTGEMFFKQTVEYTLDTGYTLNGRHNGAKKFTIRCQADGTFTATQLPQPVTCGAAPNRANAAFPQLSHTYMQEEAYDCLQGYSVDEKAWIDGGISRFSLTCYEDGNYYWLHGGQKQPAQKAKCQKVSCGVPPTHPNSAADRGTLSKKVFMDKAGFHCDPGYSLNGTLAGLTDFEVDCRANGTFSPHPGCINMNDCEGNMCEPHGRCIDFPRPTGNHLRDYTCQCDSGYELKDDERTGEHFCGNIPDCPEDACLPGSCQDLVNDYKCHCPAGYYEGENTAREWPHDCLPISCGIPPTVKDASSEQASREVFFASDPVPFTCAEGFSLDSVADGPKEFSLNCLADGSFSTPPECLEIACGEAPNVEDSDHEPTTAMVFPQKASYQCHKGYSLDATFDGDANKKFESECLADGSFAAVKPCLAIKCPALEKQSFTVNDDSGTILSFPMELAKTCMAGYALNKDEHGTTTYTIFCNEEGKLVGGSTLSDAVENWKQCEPISCGPFPTIADGTIEGSDLYSESATATCKEGFSVDRSVSRASATYVTHCQSNGEYSAHPDCLAVSCGTAPVVSLTTRSDTGEKFYEETVTYTLDTGYTLNGQHDGTKEFTITCQADGQFTALEQPQPVTCGTAPAKDNTLHPQLTHTYMQVETYDCLQGYSLDQRAWANGGVNTFSLTCKEDGQYHKDEQLASEPECQKVSCGVAAAPPHSDASDSGDKIFMEEAKFTCKPGYSLNGTLAGGVEYHITCQASGTFSPHPGCINMNDCEGNLCELNGRCVDSPSPTGTHLEDYTCDCNSGYHLDHVESTGAHTCTNTDDCPEGACSPGTCEDLVNDYACHCPSGYYVGANRARSWRHDCLPVSCRFPPTVAHAVTQETRREVFFASGPVPYSCEEGYTLDAVANGQKDFSLTCQADRSFTEAPPCLPVACGQAPHVSNSTYSADPKVFPERVPYQCDAGFSLDATFSGVSNKRFESECLADGTFTSVQPCVAIKCPALEKQSFTANDDSGTILEFPMQLAKTCMPGYALDSVSHSTTAYTISCNAQGKLVGGSALSNPVENWKQCEAISCGPLPTIAHGSITGSRLFSESATATCDTGYSIDRTASPDAATYVTRCQTTGEYSDHPDCLAVSCGSAPAVPKTTRSDEGEKFFQQTVVYSLDTGYTLNGQNDGAKQFTITCQADGSFTAGLIPQPVTCGVAPQIPNTAHAQLARTYMQEEVYSCLQGYAVDQKAWIDGGINSFNLTCYEDGRYYWVQGDQKTPARQAQCQPVSCGVAEAPAESNPRGGPSTEKFFMQEADFRCKPGYSLSGTMSGERSFQLTCRANGTYSAPPGCLNMDDCEGNMCVPHGSCVDSETPTGNHLEDYTCACDSGYFLIDARGTGEHTCGNTDDCPEGACSPGTCEDLVNDYKCHCPAGYHEGVNEARHWAHDCLPVSCGTGPSVEYATTEQAQREVFYASDPVPYTCDEGYSLDAVPAGEKEFSLTCQADGSLSAAPSCLHVECGTAPVVEAAAVESDKAWVFEETPKYTCAEGHSVGGEASLPTDFEALCDAEGFFQNVETCLANVCPVPSGPDPFGPHASYEESAAATMVFPNSLLVTCLPGYALPEPAAAASSASLLTLTDGRRTEPRASPTALHRVLAKFTGRRLMHREMQRIVATASATSNSTRASQARMFASRKLIASRGSSHHRVNRSAAATAVSAHISIFDATVIHNNLNGLGPDTGMQEIKYGNVGTVDGNQIDLVVTVSPNFQKSANSGLAQGGFGKININKCLVSEFTFMFVDHATDVPVTLNTFDVTFFDVDASDSLNLREKITAHGYDKMYTHVRPWYDVSHPSADAASVRANHEAVQNPGNPLELSEGQLQASIAFRYVNTDHFVVELGSDCERSRSGGRNFMFSFESAMVPEFDVNYLVTCEADGTFAIPADLCQPIDCGSAPTVEHATVTGGTKYGEHLVVTAADGYSLDSTTNPGAKTYNVTCQETGEFTSVLPFQKISCGTAPDMEHEAKDSQAEQVFDDAVQYTLNTGYTLDGRHDGETSYDITCQASGAFTALSTALPVECGAPPELTHASTPAATYTYGQAAPYNCAGGHSVDGTASAAKTFEIVCGADGTFGSPSGCEPIRCGDVQMPVHVEQVSDGDGEMHTSLHFGQVATFRCLPGYNKDGQLNSRDVEYNVTCPVSGVLVYPATCQNVDDCSSVANTCAPNGHCVDKEAPTGDHFSDFSCSCDSGFAEDTQGGTKKCLNIDDCPPHACDPGSCHDLLNAYECECPLGYRVGDGPSCTPVSCGTPGPVDNAAFSLHGRPLQGAASTELFFTGAPVEYTCAQGFTLDASPVGAKSFNVSCLADGHLESPETCLPVLCGKAPIPNFTTPSFHVDREFAYSQTGAYRCVQGYSLDGTARGETRFEAACEAEGVFSGVAVCQPVKCPVPEMRGVVDPSAFGEHAVFNDVQASNFLYPEEMEVTCISGYEVSGSSGVTTYSVACPATGIYIVPAEQCTPISCGDAPVVANADITGSTFFTETLTATAHAGYSLDGSTASDAKSFTFQCLASGHFSSVRSFQRIACGQAPDVEHTEAVELIAATAFVQDVAHPLQRMSRGLVISKNSSKTLPNQSLHSFKAKKVNKTVHGHKTAFMPLYGDKLQYTCAQGYHVQMRAGDVLSSDPKSFEYECMSSGDIQTIAPDGLLAAECVPVTCLLPTARPLDTMLPDVHPTDSMKRNFGQFVPMICGQGYSLDGTPSGEVNFEESCEDSGLFSREHQCSDIDWCLLSRCGEHGTCVDGSTSYTCDCEAGFERAVQDGHLETCIQIEECDTLGGVSLCGGPNGAMGTCHDETLNYTCTCAEGHENLKIDDGRDSCTPVSCEALAPHPHASTRKLGKKLTYEQTAVYVCDNGYSLDASANGGADFTVDCKADKTLNGFQDCLPVDCGTVPSVIDATANTTGLKFGEIARYTCAGDHTLTGMATGPTEFDVGCTAGGSLTETYSCQLISCGVPPRVRNTGAHFEEVHVGGTAEIQCAEGYTLDGGASSVATYTLTCQSNGSFTGMESCVKVSCGVPPKIEHSQMSLSEYFYMDQFDVLCHSGYTIDHSPTGSDTFMVTCRADGTFEGMGACLPVSCGTPSGTSSSEYLGGELFLYESANFTCKPGYSTTGTKVGQDFYIKTCTASGAFGHASPAECVDIDYCATNPCGANGLCTDSGVGIPFPGYSCSCLEGYEVTPKEGGGETCSADDCAGDPCGVGGTCTDLSTQGGPQGTYQCNCEAGYDLVEPEPGRSTCQRAACGPAPSDILDVEKDERTDMPILDVHTYSRGRPEYDTLTGSPILKSFDSATYTCADGYSTDGLVGDQSKTFTVQCLASGNFNRVLQRSLECQPVQCSNYQNMRMPNSHILHQRSVYAYGQSIHYECATGHTMDGRLGGRTTYEVPCRADGTFPDLQASCVPIECSVDSKTAATHDAGSGQVPFGRVVTYSCLSGYELGGNGSTSFVGTCEATGEVSFPFGLAPCEPVSCGPVPPVSNAHLLVMSRGMFMPMELGYEGMYGGTTIRVQCETGMALGGVAGGATFYTLSCDADKSYSSTASGVCETITFAVGGLLTDAQSASVRLNNAVVTVKSTDGVTVIASDTSARTGEFWVDLPVGTWLFTAVKDGYITVHRNVSITGYTSVGGVADMTMSQVLGEGEWRAVVEWGRHSRDIDSHVLWNNRFVYYGRPSYFDHASGIHVTLDRDDTRSFGPETTSFSGIGDCTTYSQCLVKFEIDNYTPRDGDTGSSDVRVRLYSGDRLDSEYEVPTCAGSTRTWPVFTLDARRDHVRAYAGARKMPPYLEGTGQVDWSQTFDHQMWNLAGPGELLTGFRAQALAAGGGAPEDAPVYTHISIFDAQVVHNNLGGQGPDGGPEELRYTNVGSSGSRTFDLVVTVTNGDYRRRSTNGFGGQFGKINFQSCVRADVDFTIVDSATGAPVTIASMDITFFDLDDWRNHQNMEAITISGYDEMTTGRSPWYTVNTERDGSITILANHQGVPNPSDPMALTSEQMRASAAFSFRMRSGFHATLGSICGRNSNGGRNLLFSFDSQMTPPDPGYQTGLQYLHQIQYAKTVRVQGTSEYYDCQQVTFDLTRVGWAECPAGRFLSGLYRLGSRYSEGEGVQQITQGSCCKPVELAAEWGECHEQPIFREANVMYECGVARNGRPTAVVGLHRGATHETLDDLDKMKCCGFVPTELLHDDSVEGSSCVTQSIAR